MRPLYKSLYRVVLGALLLTATAQQAHSDDVDCVQIQVPIKIRGILKQTKDGLVVETRERIQVRSLRPAKVKWEYTPRTWQLDMHMAGKYKILIDELEGKTVNVEGVAQLYQVELYNLLGDHRPVSSLSWHVERKVTVLLLRAIEK